MSADILVRDEGPGEAAAVAALVTAAFAGHPHSAGTEAAIVGSLRGDDALTLSLVAEDRSAGILGYAALSPVTFDGAVSRWHALGPLAVVPARQRGGIGTALVREALLRLRALGADGCVLVGDPAYYARFGFGPAAGLTVAAPMQPFLQTVRFAGAEPRGRVSFHPAFGA